MNLEKHQPRILAIDDTPANLQVLAAALTLDFNLQIATSGAIGLAAAAKAPPDLILLDIMMPEIDGPTVAETLKQDPLTKNIPIMFLTCLLTKPEESRLGHKIDGHFFIAKPFNPEELLKEIKDRLPS